MLKIMLTERENFWLDFRSFFENSQKSSRIPNRLETSQEIKYDLLFYIDK